VFNPEFELENAIKHADQIAEVVMEALTHVFKTYPVGSWIPNELEYRFRMLTKLLINF
jgi:hypothetical protein